MLLPLFHMVLPVLNGVLVTCSIEDKWKKFVMQNNTKEDV